MKEKLYKISEVSEILGVHPDTIRNWEEEGLINPKRIGTRGDRRYTVEDIQKIKDKNLISTLAKKNTKTRDYSSLSKEELIKEIQILNKQKTFGLVYEDKKEQIVEDCKNKAPILKPKTKFRIEDKKSNSDKPKHILIQGDNYHALKVLNYTHKNKIDVIYIDPPYNRGKKDFIYNDDYIDREDSYRHSKWISFMEKRLVLARELLKDSGVIFISIDDNEQARLKLLCDEIFGEDNFVANFIWKKTSNPNTTENNVGTEHEYILCYSKKEKTELNLIDLSEEDISDYKYKDEFFKIKGPHKLVGLNKTGTVSDRRLNLQFPIIAPDNSVIYPKPRWRWSEETYKKALLEGRIVFNQNKKNKKWTIYYKQYLYEDNFGNLVDRGSLIKTILLNNGRTTDGTIELSDILGPVASEFPFPKPSSLINYILKFSSHKNSIILDFFAGSGTTGHAVLQINKEDKGQRQVILCTNNEVGEKKEKEFKDKFKIDFDELKEWKKQNKKEWIDFSNKYGIACLITFPRIKKVIEGYKNKKQVEALGGELEYFETELVDVENMERVDDKKKLAFTLEAGWVIATKENTFKEIEKNDSYQIFEGLENIKGKTIKKTVAIYFKENLDKLKELENKVLKNKNVKLYIFSHYTNEFVSEYASYPNVKVCDIPEPILKVYRGFNNN